VTGRPLLSSHCYDAPCITSGRGPTRPGNLGERLKVPPLLGRSAGERDVAGPVRQDGVRAAR
jgi:hypothetical protein